MKTVVVVGGGISGLASAWRVREELRERGADARIVVFEREAVPGGHARTDSVDGLRMRITFVSRSTRGASTTAPVPSATV